MAVRDLRAGWRVELKAQVDGLVSLIAWAKATSEVTEKDLLVEAIESHLRAARQQLSQRGPTSRAVRVLAHLDAARTDLLRLAPSEYVIGMLPDMVMRARRALPADDLRLVALERVASQEHPNAISANDRQVVVASAAAVDEEGRHDRLRLANFKSIVLWVTALLTLLSLSVALWGSVQPAIFPVCFALEAEFTVVCPSEVSEVPEESSSAGFDVVAISLVQTTDVHFLLFLGVVGAALSTGLATRNLRSGATPSGLSASLSLLKLATGSLTSLFGIIVIRAGLVPGIDSLDSRAEIIAWALVFGFSQQLFTGVIDRRTQSVLEGSAVPPASVS